jgi:two-component system LytT family response regulator
MKNKIKVIIIDDEALARQITKNYLSKRSDIEIIAECSDGFDAIKKISELKPDLIFLDVQMPKLTGFEMIELLDSPPFIIFTTAYDHFAIKAFEVNAIDYLLKPFSEERFNAALQKAIEKLSSKNTQQFSLDNILKTNDQKEEFLERVVVKESSKIVIIPVEEIKWIEAQDDYVLINTSKGRYLKQKTMKYFESRLNQNHFVRVHRSYIVNIDLIKYLEQTETESYKLILKDGSVLPVSKSGFQRLKSRF